MACGFIIGVAVAAGSARGQIPRVRELPHSGELRPADAAPESVKLADTRIGKPTKNVVVLVSTGVTCPIGDL